MFFVCVHVCHVLAGKWIMFCTHATLGLYTNTTTRSCYPLPRMLAANQFRKFAMLLLFENVMGEEHNFTHRFVNV
jgi:hypothetical protein